jgi:hypothetical protein
MWLSSKIIGIRLMGHYLNDNTSPETFSFNVVSLTPAGGMGKANAAPWRRIKAP